MCQSFSKYRVNRCLAWTPKFGPENTHAKNDPTLNEHELVLFVKELAGNDLERADEAMQLYQACVRTTLLLCDGYECQEKKVCMCGCACTGKLSLLL